MGGDRVGEDPARHQSIGAFRDDVAQRRGSPNIGAVAAARRQLEFVFYALRDHHVRALRHPHPGRREAPDWPAADRAGHDPRTWRGRSL